MLNVLLLLFAAFCALDFSATSRLRLNYLRRFFCLKKVTLDNCPVPVALSAGEMVRLSACVLYWDKADGAIWLAPQLKRLPKFMAAKLNTDASGRNIVSLETRLSVAAPLEAAFAAVLVCLYLLTGDLAAGAGFAARIHTVCVVEMLFVVAMLIQIGTSASRLGRMAEDALEELRK